MVIASYYSSLSQIDSVWIGQVSPPCDVAGMENLFNTLHSFERAKSYAIKSEESSRMIEELYDKNAEIVIYDLFGKKIGSRYDLPYMYSKLHQGVYFIMEKDKDRVVSITKVYIEK